MIYRVNHMSYTRISDVSEKYILKFENILSNLKDEIKNLNYSESISQNYIIQIEPVVFAAAQLSQNILKYTTAISIEDIARDTSVVSKRVLKNDNLQRVCKKSNSDAENKNYLKRSNVILNEMLKKMSASLKTNNINQNYISEISPIIGAVSNLSKLARKYDICDNTLELANRIIKSYDNLIKNLKMISNKLKAMPYNF